MAMYPLWSLIGAGHLGDGPQVVFKVTCEIAVLPVTYRIVAFLKNKDQMDYFDIAVNFKPFSLKTED